MRFIIRADASEEIGAGHVMRATAIAEELIDRGYAVIFVGTTKGIPWVDSRVNTLGFVEVFDEPSQFTPCSDTDVLILDSYVIEPQSDFLENNRWKTVVAIVDDVTPSYVADLYLHCGSGTTWHPPYSVNRNRFLSGIEYVAIRKTIRSIQRKRVRLNSKAILIAVVGGGSDPLGFCKEFSACLCSLESEFRAVVFVNEEKDLPNDTRIAYRSVGQGFEKMLEEVDLVFTTAGTSSWELLSCGIPIGLALAVDNQLANYKYQIENHLAEDIGFRDTDGLWKFRVNSIELLINDPTYRKQLETNARSAVDGRGVIRIADAILTVSGVASGI